MKQQMSFAQSEYAGKKKVTRREKFLGELAPLGSQPLRLGQPLPRSTLAFGHLCRVSAHRERGKLTETTSNQPLASLRLASEASNSRAATLILSLKPPAPLAFAPLPL